VPELIATNDASAVLMMR